MENIADNKLMFCVRQIATKSKKAKFPALENLPRNDYIKSKIQSVYDRNNFAKNSRSKELQAKYSFEQFCITAIYKYKSALFTFLSTYMLCIHVAALLYLNT